MVEEAGFEPTYSERTDLQSAAFNHSATYPCKLFVGRSSLREIRRRGNMRTKRFKQEESDFFGIKFLDSTITRNDDWSPYPTDKLH